MSIDIKQVLEEISRLERLQAQVELRATQIKETEKALKDKLKTQGVTPAELDQKILELEGVIANKLTIIRSLNKPMGETTSATEEEPSIY